MPASIKQLLFDLDGTLADTGPDLAAALNNLRIRFGAAPLPYEHIRPVVSLGGAAMIQLAFGIEENAPEYATIRDAFLQAYLADIARHTVLFTGMDTLLDHLDDNGVRWGIVTNKPGWLTGPLMQALSLQERAACIISGDTLPYRKPHPAPLLHACEIMQCLPGQTAYIGDAQRDIEAGKRAGMFTIIAAYGYINDDDQINDWGADLIIDSPTALLAWLGATRTR